MTPRRLEAQPLDAAFALPIAFTGLLLIGVLAASADGRVGASAVLGLTDVLIAGTALVSQPVTAGPLAMIGWFTVAGFSKAPYGELHPSGTVRPAAELMVVAGVAAAAGAFARRLRGARDRARLATRGAQVTLDAMAASRPAPTSAPARPGRRSIGSRARGRERPSGISRHRLLAGLALAAITLPILTAALAAARSHLALIDEVLLYLLAVILVTMVGGFWPAVLASLAAGLLLNWYFTPPVHTWTIEAPQNTLALLLFVTGAVTVSSVVHLAARRSALASQRAADANTLLTLARTVLGGDDSPQTIIEQLAASLQATAELQERSGAGWVRVAGSPTPPDAIAIGAGDNVRLVIHGELAAISGVVLDGYAAQAAAALERDRLRTQAGQAEALAEGNRMRTALLAAVSHDLRTPLASVKAAVSTLRQTDVAWSAEDQAALLATIEQGADRLAALIGNLLDMSRVHAGALQPFLRPTALDEVAPKMTRGIDDGDRLHLDLPDSLPLIATDPGLLERALANLVANALRYSPPGRPPTLTASQADDTVTVWVVDHGPGVPVKERERIFEPFQQLGDQHTAGGVGLGLAVAKGFVDAIGGRIAATSTPGGGLTMRVDLPVAHRDASTRPRAPA